MYKILPFPSVATDVVRTEFFDVSIDPTFACIVVQNRDGYDIFRYDDEFDCFQFVTGAGIANGKGGAVRSMGEKQAALGVLRHWLVAEVTLVRDAWLEFFDGIRDVPRLRESELGALRRLKSMVTAGVPNAHSVSEKLRIAGACAVD